MTDEIILNHLIDYCDKEVKSYNRSTLFLVRKSIKLKQTKLLEPEEKEADFQLPRKICFPKETCDFKLNKSGITLHGILIKWPNVRLTALAVHHIEAGKSESYSKNYFMAYTINRKIINHEIGDLEEFSNLLGHFIEQYKPGSKARKKDKVL